MQQTQMKIEARVSTGKGISRKLRAAGRIPGVVYGRGMEPVPVIVEPKALAEAIAGEGGINNLITLQGGGSLDQTVVIVADLQRDVLRGHAEHVDLHRVNMTEVVRVNVPVSLLGSSAGVKAGGMLDVHHHSLHLECLPAQIPEHIEVDITNLQIAHAIHVEEISFPAGVKCLDNPKSAVVSVQGKLKEEAPAEA